MDQSLQILTERLVEFRDARDWKQFHSLKNLLLSVSIEATELLELTQWKDEKIEINAAKYPVEQARGNARKYTDL